MIERTFAAKLSELDAVTDMIDAKLEDCGCPKHIQNQINIAIDELFSNIARYAYAPNTGTVTVSIENETAPSAVIIGFYDNGKPYNPLERSDPDITLSAEDRKIGGLGIYMAKKLMDDMQYTYTDGTNILKIKKYFEEDNLNG